METTIETEKPKAPHMPSTITRGLFGWVLRTGEDWYTKDTQAECQELRERLREEHVKEWEEIA